MIESPSRRNSSLHLRPFDKYCIFVKNSVYLESLIDLLMSPAPPAMSLVCNGAQSTSPSKDHDFWDSLLRSLACVPLVHPPDVPVPLPVPSRRDPGMRPVAP